MEQEVKEIMPVVFFGYDDRFLANPDVAQLQETARRRDFRPRPVPASLPDPEPRRTQIIQQNEAGDVAPKASSATSPASDSSDDLTRSQNPENPTSQQESPDKSAPAERVQTETLFNPLANL